MNRLSLKERSQIIACLVDGNSIRATCRITGFAKNTVVKLIIALGKACAKYQDQIMHDLYCTRLECDEIWAFCYSKAANVPEELKNEFGYGDVWTWTAICAETKLVPCWLVGDRSARTASVFMNKLSSRLAKRVQLITDGHKSYIEAVEGAFGFDVDYAMLVKLYGGPNEEDQKRYSPAKCTGAEKIVVNGSPDMTKVSTSCAERQNLTMRMNMRRFTRLTNGFSKKVENHRYAVALYFMHYNFVRIHKSLRVTPAMEAGIADHVWTLEEIAGLSE